MKTRFLIVALLLATALTTRAQVHVGLSAGFNVMSVSSDFDAAEYGNNTQFAFGALLDVPLGDVLSLRFEPMYSRKGSVSRFEFQQQATRHENHIDYLELPVLAAFSFPSVGDLHPFVELGPTIGLKLGADFHALLPGGLTGSNAADVSDDIRTVDVGMAVGSGARIRTGPGWLQVSGRYSFSVSNIYDYPFDSGCADCTLPVELGNRGFQVMIGFLVPIGL